MNGDRQMSVDGRGSMDGTGWNSVDGTERTKLYGQTDVDRCWMEANGHWTELWQMAMDDGPWQMAIITDTNNDG